MRGYSQPKSLTSWVIDGLNQGRVNELARADLHEDRLRLAYLGDAALTLLLNRSARQEAIRNPSRTWGSPNASAIEMKPVEQSHAEPKISCSSASL